MKATFKLQNITMPCSAHCSHVDKVKVVFFKHMLHASTFISKPKHNQSKINFDIEFEKLSTHSVMITSLSRYSDIM